MSGIFRNPDDRMIVHFSELRELIQEGFAKAIEIATNKNTAPKPLSIADVTERYSVSKVTVHNWIKTGKIKGFKIGKGRFFHLEELENCYLINTRHHDTLVEKGLKKPYRKIY